MNPLQTGFHVYGSLIFTTKNYDWRIRFGYNKKIYISDNQLFTIDFYVFLNWVVNVIFRDRRTVFITSSRPFVHILRPCYNCSVVEPGRAQYNSIKYLNNRVETLLVQIRPTGKSRFHSGRVLSFFSSLLMNFHIITVSSKIRTNNWTTVDIISC